MAQVVYKIAQIAPMLKVSQTWVRRLISEHDIVATAKSGGAEKPTRYFSGESVVFLRNKRVEYLKKRIKGDTAEVKRLEAMDISA